MSTALTHAAKRDKIFAIVEQPERFADLLPSDIAVSRFTAVIKVALQQNPALLNAEIGSLILSCQDAARMGLLPDGKEGAIVVYGNKAQFQAMIGGLRKHVAKHGFDVRADIVCENDTFDYDLGDDPRITHKTPSLGTPRGKVIGAYAIATDAEGRKYREVMDAAQLASVASVSKNNPAWKGPFRSEMERKSVAKRLIKTLPIHDDRLAELIQRDNLQYDLDKPTGPSETATKVQSALRGDPATDVTDDAEPSTDGIEDAQFSEASTDTGVAPGDNDAPF